MSQDKLVSIAMATYNGEKYLREQLDSIYDQTYKNIEVVVTDDCSTDGTVGILEEYTQKYGLKYKVNKQNLGYTRNFIRAAELCSADYIAFADQDDIWMPEKIQLMMDEIGDNTLIHTDATLIDTEKNIIAESSKNHFNIRQYIETPEKHNKYVGLITCVQGCTILFKRGLLDKALPMPPGEQYDFWFGFVASKMEGIKYLDEKLILWRVHENNTTRRPKLMHKLYMMFGTGIYRRYRLLKRLYVLKQRGLI